MTFRRRRLVLFTRFPQAGRVKTRLIPALGPEGALALHRRLVLRTLRTAEIACRSCDADLEIRFDGGTEEDFHHWLGDGFICRPQQEGDLGDRMAATFEGSFAADTRATIIVGSDCPALTPGVLTEAFEKLESHSVVLGPAADGGYYLIGLARFVPELFCGVPWGTEHVLSESLKILARSNLKSALLASLDDVDRPEDFPVWHHIANTEDAGPPSVSVVIPALNEAHGILSTLESVGQGNPLEVLIVDGGSSDGTSEMAQKAGATVLHSKPGRARQMNAGAAKAAGSVLLFLHADTVLSAGWASVVSGVLGEAQVAAAAFTFAVAEDFKGKQMLERAVNWRSRHFQMPYGDQALFLRRSLFEEMGGFANLPIMEDYELLRRLRRRGRIVTSALPATTSGRRWRRFGLLRVTLRNQLIIAGFRLGVAPQTLARFYRGNS